MPIAGGCLTNFACRPFDANGIRHDTYWRGDGPGVILLHEIPRLTPEVLGLAERISDAGYRVVVPSLFSTPGPSSNRAARVFQMARACISREFMALAANRSGHLTDWLRA